jgi:RNA polymerase sigma factor (sigma-70 family)
MNTTTIIERHSLIISNISLADKIAKSKKKSLSHISLDELKCAAYLGLVQAAEAYNPKENDCFPAFAVWRIIGAVKDYLRELSWGPRSKPIKMENIQDDQYVKFEKEQEFEEIICDLPEVNKNILRLYYKDGFKIKEIAFEMDVHESRISQILTDSKTRLYKLLSKAA